MSMERITIGILAHVDAGKTTLSEGLLFMSGAIRTYGRVDRGDTYLDTDEMERSRGITIFSKQAVFESRIPAELLPDDASPTGVDHHANKQQTGQPTARGQLPDGSVLREYTLLDTPGHADFSPEMERTLSVLDAAVLVISAADGVNAQVRTLWSLLNHYRIPTLIFVNKMDQAEAIGEAESRKAAVLAEIRASLSDGAVDISGAAYTGRHGGSPYTGGQDGNPHASSAASGRAGGSAPVDSDAGDSDKALAEGLFHRALHDRLMDESLQEELALAEESLMESYMEGEPVSLTDIRRLIATRRLFPVLFGAALRRQGIGALLAAMDLMLPEPERGDAFGAIVYKITRDAQGERLTHLRLTGGTLAVRDEITYTTLENEAPSSEEASEDDTGTITEKITQIRLYSGDKYKTLPEASAGQVVTVTGLTETRAGQRLGAAVEEREEGLIVPVLSFQILLPMGVDPFDAYRKLKIIEEEEPMLSFSYEERKREITAHLMGEMQREILKKQVADRFGFTIAFGQPSVIYKETIRYPVEGVGHFEPLRHYAEVHLLLEPGEIGSGLVFESRCSVDALARNWQRLILTHLKERRHRGVLTGAELTDMKITLIAGRAHQKHTEGGDFRQATYRAVRQGLMMAENILLEPWYNFRVTLPEGSLGRLLSDLSEMNASFEAPEFENGTASLSGSAPVSLFANYAETMAAYTKGQGRITTEMGGYRPARKAEEVIRDSAYDPDLDKRNPSSSVFCSHGVGTIIPWWQVREFMHVDSGWRPGVTWLESAVRRGVSRAGAAGSAADAAGSVAGAAGSAAGIVGSAAGAAGNTAGASGTAAGASGTASGAFGPAGGAFGPAGGAFGPASEGWDGASVSTDEQSMLESGYRGASFSGSRAREIREGEDMRTFKEKESDFFAGEAELTAIFERTYGPIKREAPKETAPRVIEAPKPKYRKPRQRPDKEYLLVDGYNMIFAWDDLRALGTGAKGDIKAARDKLLDLLSNYAGFTKRHVICVFDAYRVPGGREQVYRYHNIDVIFTKEAETADQYIEKAAHELTKQYLVTVATSDAIEQVIIFGAGALRLSASNFREEIRAAEAEMKTRFVKDDHAAPGRVGTALADLMPEIPGEDG